MSKITFSVTDEILKFKQLLDMRAITQEEFDKKKVELISIYTPSC
ncbi:SHOCT domain-containing protein [Clostridium sp. UBA4548]|nr:SHOCT domain-containing protein [Clostridium sp. UBA4548]